MFVACPCRRSTYRPIAPALYVDQQYCPPVVFRKRNPLIASQVLLSRIAPLRPTLSKTWALDRACTAARRKS
jgi:hypothetical protein